MTDPSGPVNDLSAIIELAANQYLGIRIGKTPKMMQAMLFKKLVAFIK